MPLLKGKSHIGANIKELKKGPQYKRTKKKFGKGKADRQAIAIALDIAGMSKMAKMVHKKWPH